MDQLLALAKIPKSTYYYHQKKMLCPDKYATVKEAIRTIFEYNKGRYGYRRIHIVLRQYGYTINHKTLQKLMKELSLQGKRKTRKYETRVE